jgi:TRAP-type C4-dicarboxylate transport system permease small subunit
MAGTWIIVAFLVLMFLGIPIAYALALSALFYMLVFVDVPTIIIVQQILAGVDKFTLMAIPFFVVAGSLMEYGGISSRIALDLPVKMMKNKPQLLLGLKLLQCVGALVFGSFMSVHMLTIVSTQFSTDEFTPVLGIPLWFVNSGGLLGSLLIVLFVLQQIFLLIVRKKAR